VKMALSHRALVPLAVLFGASLHGCSFQNLPPVVQIKIGHECGERVSGLSSADGLKNLGKEQGCAELDQEKLTALELTNCDEVLKTGIRWASEVECEGQISDKVVSKCAEVSADCKKSIEDDVAAWEMSAVEQDKTQKDNGDKEGFEAVLALLHACHEGAKGHFRGLGDEATEACASVHSDNLTAMGITDAHCNAYLKKETISMMTIVCVGTCLNKEDIPDADRVSLDYINGAAGDYYQELAVAAAASSSSSSSSSGARLRLFETAMKSRQWPQRAKVSMGQIAMGGCAMLTAMAALAVVVRRRSQRVEAQEEELLESME